MRGRRGGKAGGIYLLVREKMGKMWTAYLRRGFVGRRVGG